MRPKRLVFATALGLLLAFLPATVLAHGGLMDEELDPRILGPTLALGLALFVSIFGFMLTGPAWLFGLPEEPDDDRVINLQDVRTRRQRGYRRGQEERREEERPWRGRSAG